MADDIATTVEGEQDPVADFLQREQDQLADLDESFAPVSSEVTANKELDGSEFLDGEEFNASAGYGTVNPTKGGDMWDPENPPTSTTTTSESGAGMDNFNAIRSEDKQEQEPEKMRIWREEQAKSLKLKDEDSEKKKAEWREAAKKELEDWYKHREELLEKTKAVNRSGMKGDSEDSFVKDRDDKTDGAEWERACAMCDFNPKSSRNSKDVSRMRSILLQLKQTPITRA